eukprot:4314234-Prymnesium_polylepis.1
MRAARTKTTSTTPCRADVTRDRSDSRAGQAPGADCRPAAGARTRRCPQDMSVPAVPVGD